MESSNVDSLLICKDGTKLFSGGADKAGRLLDLNTGQTMQVAAHDGPIKCARWIDNIGGMNNVVVTGSWDKTLRVNLSIKY
jgi:mRNA export factor